MNLGYVESLIRRMKRTVFALLVSVFLCSFAYGAKKDSNLDYLVTPKMSDVAFSPDGKRFIALVKPAYGNASLGVWTVGVDEPTLVKVVDREGGGGPKKVLKAMWIDESSVAVLSEWKSGANALSVWRKGKAALSPVLKSARYDLVGTNAERSEILVTEFPSWGRFGTCRVLKLGKGGKKRDVLYECESSLIEAHCDRDGVLRLVKRNREKGGPLVWFARAKGASDWTQTRLTAGARVYGFDYDSDTLWVGGYFEKNSAPGIYRYSVSKDELLGLVSKNRSLALSECAEPQFSDTLEQVVGLHVDLVKARSQWSHPLFQKLQEKIDAIFKDSDNRILAWSPDLGKLVIQRSFPGLPAQTTFIDLVDPNVRLLFVNGKRVRKEGAARREVVRVPAPGGRKITAVLSRREGGEGRRPLVVLLRPDPWSSLDTADWNAEEQFLAAEGYAVLRVNFKGSGPLLGKDWNGWKTEADVMAPIEDLDTVIDWIGENHEDVDTAKVGIVGTASSGWLATYAACARPERYRAVVSNMGIYDLREYRKEGRIRRMADLPFARSKRFDDAALGQFSPVGNFESMKAALFIAYSDKGADEYVSQVKDAIRAAKKAGVRLHKPYVGSWWGERIPNDSQLQAYYGEVSRFLKKAL